MNPIGRGFGFGGGWGRGWRHRHWFYATGLPGWAPPGGWIVQGARQTVCSVGNLVCFIDNAEASLNEVMRELSEASHY